MQWQPSGALVELGHFQNVPAKVAVIRSMAEMGTFV